MNKVVVHKPTIPLIRKRTYLPIQPSVKIIVSPAQVKSVKLPEYRQQLSKPLSIQPPPLIQNKAISKNSLLSKKRIGKKGTVIYKSGDPSPESFDKLKSLRHSGRNKILVIVGNGPSISEIALDRLANNRSIDIMSVNKPDPRVWPTSHWIFFDLSQFRRHESLWNNYEGWIFNSTGIKRQKPRSIQFKNRGGKGFSRDPLQGIYIGMSSVYAAMQIGLWLEYTHIYIVGADMGTDNNGKLYFYGDNPDAKPEVRKSRFEKEAEHYDFAATELSEVERMKFTFCSSYNKWPFVNKFNKLDHLVSIDAILGAVSQLSS